MRRLSSSARSTFEGDVFEARDPRRKQREATDRCRDVARRGSAGGEEEKKSNVCVRRSERRKRREAIRSEQGRA